MTDDKEHIAARISSLITSLPATSEANSAEATKFSEEVQRSANVCTEEFMKAVHEAITARLRTRKRCA